MRPAAGCQCYNISTHWPNGQLSIIWSLQLSVFFAGEELWSQRGSQSFFSLWDFHSSILGGGRWGEVGVRLRAFSTGVNAYLKSVTLFAYFKTATLFPHWDQWNLRRFTLQSFKWFLCSHQVPNAFSSCSLSSQCVPNFISLCPVCFAQTLSAWNICRWQDSGTHIFSTPAGFCYTCINWEEGRWQRTVGRREVESKKLFMNASIFRIFLVMRQSMRRIKIN